MATLVSCFEHVSSHASRLVSCETCGDHLSNKVKFIVLPILTVGLIFLSIGLIYKPAFLAALSPLVLIVSAIGITHLVQEILSYVFQSRLQCSAAAPTGTIQPSAPEIAPISNTGLAPSSSTSIPSRDDSSLIRNHTAVSTAPAAATPLPAAPAPLSTTADQRDPVRVVVIDIMGPDSQRIKDAITQQINATSLPYTLETGGKIKYAQLQEVRHVFILLPAAGRVGETLQENQDAYSKMIELAHKAGKLVTLIAAKKTKAWPGNQRFGTEIAGLFPWFKPDHSCDLAYMNNELIFSRPNYPMPTQASLDGLRNLLHGDARS